MRKRIWLIVGVAALVLSIYALLGSVNLADIAATGHASKSDFRCGGGFVGLPPELEAEFAGQSSIRAGNASADSERLTHDVMFRGFFLTLQSVGPKSEKRPGFSTCPESAVTWPNEVQFVPDDINWLLRSYISAVISNESTLYETATKNLSEVRLCTQIACGATASQSNQTPFAISNSADLTYARIYTDSVLQLDLMSKLDQIAKTNERSLVLDEQIRVDLVTSARRIAILHTAKDR